MAQEQGIDLNGVSHRHPPYYMERLLQGNREYLEKAIDANAHLVGVCREIGKRYVASWHRKRKAGKRMTATRRAELARDLLCARHHYARAAFLLLFNKTV